MEKFNNQRAEAERRQGELLKASKAAERRLQDSCSELGIKARTQHRHALVPEFQSLN
jgi:hypothetical protein